MVTMRSGSWLSMAGLAAALLLAQSARPAEAVTVPLGVANGGVGIYYNNNGNGESPTNQAYAHAQFSLTNTNGSEFNFDATPLPGTGGSVSWFSVFQAVPNQFGVDLILTAPTNDNTVTIPSLHAFENTNGSIGGRADAGPVTWAISGYTGPTVGPANPANAIINSVFRGGTGNNNGVTFNTGPVQQSGSLFTVTVSGDLDTDGLVHWYNPATPNSPVSNLLLTGKFFFSGTLTYNSQGPGESSSNLIDFYGGSIAIEAEVLCGPRYVNVSTGQDTVFGNLNGCLNPLVPCQTIQHAVDLACPGYPGDTINVAAGVYPEQVKITKDGIAVTGPGAIVRPSTVVSGTDQGSPCSGSTGTAIVLVSGATGVNLNGLSVDGSLAGTANGPPRFIGVYYRNASGAINGGSVVNIRENPFSGNQNGLGILVQAKGPVHATVDITGVTVSGYQKNGVTYNGCGCANAIDGIASGAFTVSTVTGAGPTPLIAQNGVQVGFGAGPVTISGNDISGNSYTGNPSNGTGAGVLLFSSTANIVDMNDITNNNDGVSIASGDFILCDPGDSTGHSITCNRIADNDISGIITDAAANSANNNSILGNAVGVDGTGITSGVFDAESNWWGCAAGPGNAGCDTATANVDYTPVLGSAPACVVCTQDTDCADGTVCNGAETCLGGACSPGTPLNCNDGNPCTFDACDPLAGCQNPPGGGGDPDGDGICSANDNCPTVANLNQADLDNDGAGNVCDPVDAVINVTRAQLKLSKGGPNGKVSAKGDFLTAAVGDPFDATAGIIVRVQDNLGFNMAHTFATCAPVSGSRIKCRDGNFRAQFTQFPSSPLIWRFSVKFSRQVVVGPFQGPVTVTISHDTGIDRVDSISDCRARNTGLACREF